MDFEKFLVTPTLKPHFLGQIFPNFCNFCLFVDLTKVEWLIRRVMVGWVKKMGKISTSIWGCERDRDKLHYRLVLSNVILSQANIVVVFSFLQPGNMYLYDLDFPHKHTHTRKTHVLDCHECPVRQEQRGLKICTQNCNFVVGAVGNPMSLLMLQQSELEAEGK